MFRKGFVSLFVLVAIASASTPTDQAVQAALGKDLSKYANVKVQVEDRIVQLSGTVASYLDKLAIARKARGYGAVTHVNNIVIVDGARVPDQALAEKLARTLAYDRSNQGSVFNWFTVSVEDGKVTLAGYARNYVDRDSALAIVASAAGVRDVQNKVEVLPVSIFDDQIRFLAARRIYSGVQIQAALNPAHPIRIIVNNGKVILEGAVNSKVDRALAEARLAGIMGIFSVENHLQVTRG